MDLVSSGSIQDDFISEDDTLGGSQETIGRSISILHRFRQVRTRSRVETN